MDREKITLENFREKFCNKCFWQKFGNCDIGIVKIDCCCHSMVEKWKYEIIKDNKI